MSSGPSPLRVEPTRRSSRRCAHSRSSRVRSGAGASGAPVAGLQLAASLSGNAAGDAEPNHLGWRATPRSDCARVCDPHAPSSISRVSCRDLFGLGARDMDHAPHRPLAPRPTHQQLQQLARIEAIRLRPPLPAIHFDTRRIDHEAQDAHACRASGPAKIHRAPLRNNSAQARPLATRTAPSLSRLLAAARGMCRPRASLLAA